MEDSKKKQVKKRETVKKNSGIKKITVFFLFVTLCLYIALQFIPTKRRISLKELYGISSDEVAVFTEDKKSDINGLMIDGEAYIPWEVISAERTMKLFMDLEEGVLSYVYPGTLIRVYPNERSYKMNGEDVDYGRFILVKKDNRLYISLSFLEIYEDMVHEFYGEPNRVILHYDWQPHMYYKVAEETILRAKPGIKGRIVCNVKVDDKLLFIVNKPASDEKYTCVMTKDGAMGYIETQFLGEQYYEQLKSNYVEPTYVRELPKGNIHLGWHAVSSEKYNAQFDSLVGVATSLNVISPTWFRVIDKEGSISSWADKDYVDKAHRRGIQVWALVDNFDKSAKVSELLQHTSARESLINNLMAEAKEIGFDGINVDFELVDKAVAKEYLEFLKELSVACKLNNLVLSVDNYVPYNYNQHYNLEEQGKFVDYVIIMAYDEHYSGSSEPGSVSSISYIKRAVDKTIEQVEKERVIIALPFYTRLWVSYADNSLESEMLSMNDADAYLKKKNVKLTWDETTKQYYAEFKAKAGACKIWMEDIKSIEEKLKVVKNANVGGVAAWRLGYEKSDVWAMIKRYIN